MADDIGLEALGVNGAVNYQTPVLDSLARNGINFINAINFGEMVNLLYHLEIMM